MVRMEMNLQTNAPKQVMDLTGQVTDLLQEGVKSVSVFVASTGCGITTADMSVGTDLDLLDALTGMVPKLNYRHQPNPAAVAGLVGGSMIGSSVTVPVLNGKLALGPEQKIVLVELDGPKPRQVYITKHYN